MMPRDRRNSPAGSPYGNSNTLTIKWVTIHKTRDLNIRRRRVSLAEIYCSISENFHIVYTSEAGESSVGVTPACGGVEVGGVVTLPAPRVETVVRPDHQRE